MAAFSDVFFHYFMAVINVISVSDRKRSTCIREKNKVKNIMQVVKQQKWRWAGHVARMNDNRWTKRLTDWHPYNKKRSRKRPVAWQRIAQDRQLWQELGKAFIQQWTYNG